MSTETKGGDPKGRLFVSSSAVVGKLMRDRFGFAGSGATAFGTERIDS